LLPVCLVAVGVWPNEVMALEPKADLRLADPPAAERPPAPPGQPVGPQAPQVKDSPVAEYRPDNWPAESSVTRDALRMLLTLAAVLIVLGLAVRLLRRWPGCSGGEGLMAELSVLGRVALTPKEGIYLVRAGGEVLVVGVSPAGVTLLTRMEERGLEATRGSAGLMGAPRGSGAFPGAAPRQPSCLHELAARVREVQAAWGIRQGALRGKR
jgi:flagellar biogenesis protein FliO